MDNQTFSEPKSLDDARKRKQDLLIEYKKICLQLSDKKITVDRAHGSNEYRQWRKRAIHKSGIMQMEIAYLNNWMKDYHSSYQRMLVTGTNSEQVKGQAHECIQNLLKYCNGLEEELRQAQQENMNLRNQLSQMVTTQPVAPNDGVDTWREDAQ